MSINKIRRVKSLIPHHDEGEPIHVHLVDGSVPGRTAAIVQNGLQRRFDRIFLLLRSNFMARMIETVFLRKKIPYQLVRCEGFLGASEVRDVIAWTRLLLGDGARFEELERGAERLENLTEMCSLLNAAPDADGLTRLLRDAAAAGQDPAAVVKIMTVHGAKGLEAPLVVVPFLDEGLFPTEKAVRAAEEDSNPVPLEDERKLAYVAMTRAQVSLHLVAEAGTESRFIAEIPAICRRTVQDEENEADMTADDPVSRLQSFLDHAATAGWALPADLMTSGAPTADGVSALAAALEDPSSLERLKLIRWGRASGKNRDVDGLLSGINLLVSLRRAGEAVAAGVTDPPAEGPVAPTL